MGGRIGSAALTLAALAVVCLLVVRHRADVTAAFAAVPAAAAAAAVALHVATLFLRSEAWRVTLASAGADRLARRAVHGANAAAFLAGALQSQAALPARVAMLRRLGGRHAPGAGVICVADVPIFCLELCATALLLCAGVLAGTGALWIAPLAAGVMAATLAGVILLSRRFTHRPMLRGLAVLDDRERRGALVALVASISALTVARVWVVLAACGLPHGLGEVAAAFAALGVFGLLPIGPGAPPSALLAAAGAASAGAAIAAGLLLGATSIVAVLVYALLAGVLPRLAWRRAAPPRRSSVLAAQRRRPVGELDARAVAGAPVR